MGSFQKTMRHTTRSNFEVSLSIFRTVGMERLLHTKQELHTSGPPLTSRLDHIALLIKIKLISTAFRFFLLLVRVPSCLTVIVSNDSVD
jgi:hypothetical protein